MPCPCGGLSLCVPPFVFVVFVFLPEAVLIKALNVRVHIEGLVEGHSGGLLSGGECSLSLTPQLS